MRKYTNGRKKIFLNLYLHKIALILNFKMEWKLKMKRQSEQYQNEIDKL
jgi:hypothetical protein